MIDAPAMIQVGAQGFTLEAVFGFGSVVVSILVAAVTLARGMRGDKEQTAAILTQLVKNQDESIRTQQQQGEILRALQQSFGLQQDEIRSLARLHSNPANLCPLTSPSGLDTLARRVAEMSRTKTEP